MPRTPRTRYALFFGRSWRDTTTIEWNLTKGWWAGPGHGGASRLLASGSLDAAELDRTSGEQEAVVWALQQALLDLMRGEWRRPAP